MEAVGTRSARSLATMETCSILDSDVTPVKLPTAPGNMGSAVVSGMKVNTNLNSNTKPEISTEKGAYSGKGKELEKQRRRKSPLQWWNRDFFLVMSAPPHELRGHRDKDFVCARQLNL
jgi:hypothetical protein